MATALMSSEGGLRVATHLVKRLVVLWCLGVLAACSPRHLIINSMADELAQQGAAQEEDLALARDASAFYLKLSESVLRETPGNLKLAEAVTSGFTQYSFAFVATQADQVERRDPQAAHQLRLRAARLYRRAQQHAKVALESRQPGFFKQLASPNSGDWPAVTEDHMGLVYWACAAWGGWISLSKDDPDTLADLPLAFRLASLAWRTQPDHGNGRLASLMGSFEASRPGGSPKQALAYFDKARQLSGDQNAGVLVAQAESIALPVGDRAGFETLLHKALAIPEVPQLPAQVMRARAQWLLDNADELF